MLETASIIPCSICDIDFRKVPRAGFAAAQNDITCNRRRSACTSETLLSTYLPKSAPEVTCTVGNLSALLERK